MISFNSQLKIVTVLLAVTTLSACSPAQFTMYDDSNKALKAPDDPTVDPPKVCDPFDPSNIVSSTSGLQGTIHYLESNATTYPNSADYINHGKKVNADLFLNRLIVPTRIFDTGFAADGGVPLKNSDGNVLVEWFGLNLKSKLKLGSGDAEGDYQLAILSDDGSTLHVQNSLGVFTPVVSNEGQHPTKLGCATTTVSLSKSTKIPMNLTYYQGPRQHIALTLMWRKVTRTPGGSELGESECGKSGNDYFFDTGTATKAAVPKSPYLGLLARGWKPLNAENFELQSGYNRCAL